MVVASGADGFSNRGDHVFDLTTRERVARAVATLVYYHKDGGSWAAAGLLQAEAPALMRWLSSGPDRTLKDRVLTLIESDLRDRYDEDVARRLHRTLLSALNDAGVAAREAETPHLRRGTSA